MSAIGLDKTSNIKPPRLRRAFTLIELLVVIAILLPAVQQAREHVVKIDYDVDGKHVRKALPPLANFPEPFSLTCRH